VGRSRFQIDPLEDIDRKPFPAFPPSARLAVLVGEPSQAGPYLIRVKVPLGVKLMPHRHPEDRVYTVMSGVFYIGLGESVGSGSRRVAKIAKPSGSKLVKRPAESGEICSVEVAQKFDVSLDWLLLGDASLVRRHLTKGNVAILPAKGPLARKAAPFEPAC
jgi:hypothetical protein